MPDILALLQPLKDRLAAANPNGSEWEPLTDPGDRKTAPAWIVDADDLEIRMDATYAAGKVATFVAAAPADQAKLIAAIEAAERAMVGRAESYAETSDRLNQQVIDRHPDRDPEAAARYANYASSANAALGAFRHALTQALGGDTA